MIKHDDYEFYKVSNQYVTRANGLTVSTVNFKSFIVSSKAFRLGTKNFTLLKKSLNELKKLAETDHMKPLHPAFNNKISGEVRIKIPPVNTVATLVFDGEKITLTPYPWTDGIYTIEFTAENVNDALENPREYAVKTHVRIKAQEVKKS